MKIVASSFILIAGAMISYFAYGSTAKCSKYMYKMGLKQTLHSAAG